MNRVLKKGLILGAIGFVGGLFIGLTVFYLTEPTAPLMPDFSKLSLFELIIGGIYGALAMGTSAVYDIESWSIAKCTFTHFIFTFVGLFVLARVQGWLNPGAKLMYVIAAAFIIIYIIIWLSQYLLFKRKVRQLNDDLEMVKKG